MLANCAFSAVVVDRIELANILLEEVSYGKWFVILNLLIFFFCNLHKSLHSSMTMQFTYKIYWAILEQYKPVNWPLAFCSTKPIDFVRDVHLIRLRNIGELFVVVEIFKRKCIKCLLEAEKMFSPQKIALQLFNDNYCQDISSIYRRAAFSSAIMRTFFLAFSLNCNTFYFILCL